VRPHVARAQLGHAVVGVIPGMKMASSTCRISAQRRGMVRATVVTGLNAGHERALLAVTGHGTTWRWEEHFVPTERETNGPVTSGPVAKRYGL
jgi:hypothetical protein